MTHLFVTNDFPPKIGGIQTMLWELWRRLDPASFVVLTTPHPDAEAWDAEQPFRIVRAGSKVLLPTRALIGHIDAVAREAGARLVVLDPALPLGLVGPRLQSAPYAVVLHGAEVTVPGRLPVARRLLRHVLRGADLVVAAGGYPLAEGERAAGRPLPHVVVPPGVDTDRFVPLEEPARRATRARLGLPAAGPLVVSVSRLVPRKGMDVLIEAAARLAPAHPGLTVAIAGGGRDERRLERLVERTGAPVRLLGRVPHEDLPGLYACGDVFAMLCRNRWGGLEQEGFGIVFVEAAAAGVPQVAGDSGGAAEAVEDGVTGRVVADPRSPAAVASAIDALLRDHDGRARMAVAGRDRAVRDFSYDALAVRLGEALASWEAGPRE
jgi:phosphatidylinositol alpha-1,6-mannosyltransferase